ncbi:hypothetical protein [Thioalkalivibrio sulfidiphilus]|uniref:hypothetical protein n=1 Tax=Thioalkalivibrio sulfidiphilus TaxID=1033854 RepID=UPI003B3370DC
MSKSKSLFRQFFDGLAHEQAGEFLTSDQKLRTLGAATVSSEPELEPARPMASRVRIGLILGSVLSAPAAAFALESAQRLDASLVVYSFQDEAKVLAQITGHLPESFNPDDRVEIRRLKGSSNDAIQRAVNRTHRLQFLVCDADGFTGHGITHSLHVDLKVPVVAVARCDRDVT